MRAMRFGRDRFWTAEGFYQPRAVERGTNWNSVGSAHQPASQLAKLQKQPRMVRNATKYSPTGGRVWVNPAPGQVMVDITVDHEGIGLDAREVETIFERYGRGDTALQHGIRGHGLGLFICRRIAESHGGTIYARPRATGSCFTLVLALRQSGTGAS